jgi:hypothetical protein
MDALGSRRDIEAGVGDGDEVAQLGQGHDCFSQVCVEWVGSGNTNPQQQRRWQTDLMT